MAHARTAFLAAAAVHEAALGPGGRQRRGPTAEAGKVGIDSASRSGAARGGKPSDSDSNTISTSSSTTTTRARGSIVAITSSGQPRRPRRSCKVAAQSPPRRAASCVCARVQTDAPPESRTECGSDPPLRSAAAAARGRKPRRRRGRGALGAGVSPCFGSIAEPGQSGCRHRAVEGAVGLRTEINIHRSRGGCRLWGEVCVCVCHPTGRRRNGRPTRA